MTQSLFKKADRAGRTQHPLIRRDIRPSVCAVCARPSVGLMVKDPNLSTIARPKYWGACSQEHVDMIKSGQRPAIKNKAIVNEDSADYARQKAGLFIKAQHATDLRLWSKDQSKAFIKTIIRAYLNCEFDNKEEE